jgi:MFS family permease
MSCWSPRRSTSWPWGLAVRAILGVAEVWHIIVAAVLSGLSNALDGPSRSAFLFEMVGVARLRKAISLTAMSFHLGGLIGPALSGLLSVAVGSGRSMGIGFSSLPSSQSR